MFPAGEPGEVQTVTFLGGPFGNGREGTIHPIKVEVVGDLKFFPSIGMNGLGSGEVFSGKGISLSNYQGMDYQTASIHLISAEIREYDPNNFGELRAPAPMYPNDCTSAFPNENITHRIRVITNGGPTRDGLQGYTNTTNDKGVFIIKIVSESEDDSILDDKKYIGLADHGDGDNMFDLCLDLLEDDVDKIRSVQMPCTNEFPAVPPKGFPNCMTNSIEVKQMIGGDTTEVESKTAEEGGDKVSGSNESSTSTMMQHMMMSIIIIAFALLS